MQAGTRWAGFRRVVLTAALAVAALAALVPLAALAASPDRAGGYVALGDSFASGPLLPSQSLYPLGCLRSSNNYARLAAPGIGLPLEDQSCSGARTNDMTDPQNVAAGPNPPQFDALGSDTELVSVTIGGNDIGFSEVARSCLTANPCRDRYSPGGNDQLAARIAATAPKVDAVLDGIRARSPRADVYLVNYPAIFPQTGSGCWPQLPIGRGDVPYLRQTQRGLNAMLAAEAAANGATLVDWYAASIGHDACKPLARRWVEPLVPATLAAPIHPNRAGMRAAAALLVGAARG